MSSTTRTEEESGGNPASDATPEQRAQWAESRHMFWRNRCLEHARTIDRQEALIYELRTEIKRLEKERDERTTGAASEHS